MVTSGGYCSRPSEYENFLELNQVTLCNTYSWSSENDDEDASLLWMKLLHLHKLFIESLSAFY